MRRSIRNLALVLGLLLTTSIGAIAANPVQIPVMVTVKPHAVLTVNQSLVDFGELSGEAGIYHLNGPQFLGELKKHWNHETEIRLPGGNQDGRSSLGIVTVTSNTNVDVTFEFVEGTNWITAPTLFGIWNDGPNAGYHGRFFGNASFSKTTTTRQGSGPRQYIIVGGIFIEEVHVVEAGDYEAEIVVTVAIPN